MTNKKEILLVDIDDTLTFNIWYKRINHFLGTNYSRSDIKTYSIDKLITDNTERLKFVDYVLTKYFYEDAEIFPNAIEVMKKLYEKYDLYICSACVLDVGKGLTYINAYEAKFKFLRDNFPFISGNRFIFTQNKNIINADIIIDDSLFNLYGPEKTKIMINSHMNCDVTNEDIKKLNITKVDGWNDIAKILL